jgi:hypothetical protein
VQNNVNSDVNPCRSPTACCFFSAARDTGIASSDRHKCIAHHDRRTSNQDAASASEWKMDWDKPIIFLPKLPHHRQGD